jgi:Mg-chelatase subunit ChlD
MANRPGGKLAARPLLFEWIVDCSGSMSVNGKMDAVNASIRAALPVMRRAAQSNPSADVHVRTLAFSHLPMWVDDFKYVTRFEWVDLIADPLDSTKLSAEVVFLMDTSGSMSDEIDAIRQNCVSFADQITRKGADVRLGLVGFDIGGHSGKPRGTYQVHNLSEYTIGTWPLNEPRQFKSHIQELRLGQFGGGGCYLADRSTIEIFPHVIKIFSPDSHHTRRFLVIISDEIGSTEGVDEIARVLKEAGVVTHVMGVGTRGKAHRQIAESTRGMFWNIRSSATKKDFSELLATVADKIGEEAKQTLVDGSTSGGTDLGSALSMVASNLDLKMMPARALPPVLVLITDGKTTDDVQPGLKELNKRHWGKKAVRLSIGIGADADMNLLQKFIGNTNIKPLTAKNPDILARYIRWASTAVLESASCPASQCDTRSSKQNFILPRAPHLIADRFDDDERW